VEEEVAAEAAEAPLLKGNVNAEGNDAEKPVGDRKGLIISFLALAMSIPALIGA